MEAKEYKRWALNGLREQAKERGIVVTGKKNEPRLLLRQRDDLLIFYQEEWWRSAFRRSGYGGSLWFEMQADNSLSNPAIVLLDNLRQFFLPMRSPENLAQIDYFIDRLVQLADWCANERLAEFSELARAPGTALSKVGRAAKELRQFPFQVSSPEQAEVR